MKRIPKIILYGFLIWLIVFIVSVIIYPIHDVHRPFFESIMPVTIVLCTVVFSILYFEDEKNDLFQEGFIVGFSWLAINIIIDLFFFMEGPMKMSIGDYMMDIGFTYLIIPIITSGFAYILEKKED
jgi:uncharacterized membrane protein YpjA